MGIDEWFEQTETGKRKALAKARKEAREQTLWDRVSQQAKEKKLRNKKSKRDAERETRIASLGGTTINVEYGFPLSDRDRVKRIEYEIDLKYPNRKEKQQLKKETQLKRLKKLRTPAGSKRSFEALLKNTLRTARKRASDYGVPFDITLEDIEITTHCPILGTKFSWGSTIENDTPSLDRVVPKLGYVKGNVRVISMRANRLKNNATIEEMEAILEYMKGHR